jgi:hypothetical protein
MVVLKNSAQNGAYMTPIQGNMEKVINDAE